MTLAQSNFKAQPRIVLTRDDMEQILYQMEENPRLEFVDGELVEKPVSEESCFVEGSLMRCVGPAARDAGHRSYPCSLTYKCFADDPDRIRRPDFSIIRGERFAALDAPAPALMPIVPDLAVEVVSTHDKASKLNAKIREYLDAGVPVVWVLLPETRSVEVHQGRSMRRLSADDTIDAGDLLPGWSVQVSELFDS